jgi:hypothetical protein
VTNSQHTTNNARQHQKKKYETRDCKSANRVRVHYSDPCGCRWYDRGLSFRIIHHGGEKESGSLLYAEAGARDALIRLARDKNYSTSPNYTIEFATGGCASPYDGCATVTVSSGVGSSGIKGHTPQGSPNCVRSVSVSVQYDMNLRGSSTIYPVGFRVILFLYPYFYPASQGATSLQKTFYLHLKSINFVFIDRMNKIVIG